MQGRLRYLPRRYELYLGGDRTCQQTLLLLLITCLDNDCLLCFNCVRSDIILSCMILVSTVNIVRSLKFFIWLWKVIIRKRHIIINSCLLVIWLCCVVIRKPHIISNFCLLLLLQCNRPLMENQRYTETTENHVGNNLVLFLNTSLFMDKSYMCPA
jgi:hypothetical protein